MIKLRGRFFYLVLFTLMLSTAVYCQGAFTIPEGNAGLREYFPGDIIHIVIEAPLDTAYVRATMPDGEEVNLTYDGRSNLWHGYWEVPAGFQRGLYRAKLNATDVEGNIFAGESSNFFVSEPALALMMKLPTKVEIERGREISSKEALARQRAIEAGRLAKEEERKQAMSQQLAEGYASPPPPRQERAAIKRTKPKPAVNKAAVENISLALAKQAEDKNVKKAQLAIKARAYLAKMQYQEAKGEIEQLLNIEPNNRDIRVIYNRLEAVIRARSVE